MNGVRPVPMLLAVVEATVISRLLRARSIYSARLPGTSVDAHEASYGDIDVVVTADGGGVLLALERPMLVTR